MHDEFICLESALQATNEDCNMIDQELQLVGQNAAGDRDVEPLRDLATKEVIAEIEESVSGFLEDLRTRKVVGIGRKVGKLFFLDFSRSSSATSAPLERDALNKGLSVGKAHDIDIPPPRPKRKPSNPYPRKTAMAALTSSPAPPENNTTVSSPHCTKPVFNFEIDPTAQKCTETRSTQGKTKEIPEATDSPEVINLFEETPCVSISSASKGSTPKPLVLATPNPGAFKELMPRKKEINDQNQMDEVSATTGSKGNLKLERMDAGCADLDIGRPKGFKPDNQAAALQIKKELNSTVKVLNHASKEIELQSTQSYPRHVPIQVLDGNDIAKFKPSPLLDLANPASMAPHLGSHGNPSILENPTFSATSELDKNSEVSAVWPPFSTFHPHFTNFHCNSNTQKLPTPACAPDISSAVSSLIITNLLRNPAAHAAANLAASCFPCMDMENSIDTAALFGLNGGAPFGCMNQPPSVAAIATATVAAATAWWATHGPLPFCTPPRTSFTFAPTPSATTIPITENSQPPLSGERKEQPPLHPEFSATVEAQREASASPPSSSSYSEESLDTDPDGTKLETAGDKQEQLLMVIGSDSGKPRNLLDRSSCGSNTTSGSEAEMDAVLEKHGEIGKEASKGADPSHPLIELSSRRSRSAGSVNDSWKEVSQEGRLAFKALFSREVLPQNFSPRQDLINKVHLKSSSMEEGKQNLSKRGGEEDTVQLDLNGNGSLDHSLEKEKEKEKDESPTPLLRINAEEEEEEGMAIPSVGGQGMLKCRGRGFKPYKRCSMEAEESGSQIEEKGSKRIRLQGKAAAM